MKNTLHLTELQDENSNGQSLSNFFQGRWRNFPESENKPNIQPGGRLYTFRFNWTIDDNNLGTINYYGSNKQKITNGTDPNENSKTFKNGKPAKVKVFTF